MKLENDLGRDKISRLVLRIALPSMLAQFVNVLYSIVDRMFVGNIPETGNLSLAGVGVCGPILTMIGAFAFLVGFGGTPLMGISLGEGKKDRASDILANSFLLIGVISVFVTGISFLIKEPMLRLFGATDNAYIYAEQYFEIYVSGTVFSLISVGMAQFIIAQGYSKMGMVSVIIGALMNIALDPLFIYVFDMGVRGAALATVISQAARASCVLYFLFRKADIKITFGNYDIKTILNIIKLGLSPFIIIALDNVMIIAMNALLKTYGQENCDMLITVNTIVQSFMLIVTMPLGGISGSTQCILSYNYGAGNTDRVKKGQKYIFLLCVIFTAIMFVSARLGGKIFASMFTSDENIRDLSFRAIKISTLFIVPLGIQYEIVDGFTSMGLVKYSLPLSMFRKCVYFIALFIIPHFFEASKIFYAEPISDISALICSSTVYFLTIGKVLKKRENYIRSCKDIKERNS